MNELKQNALLNSASHSPNSAKRSPKGRVLGSINWNLR
ncbi:hypothetical protein LEP1GSC021_3015 [Leptospira noguchii str. 1993005606]|nr:hypothetical protein LEP1GSC021_3015 [Leptospira noguchii str. 1993005606]